MMDQWLELLPHTKNVRGSVSSWGKAFSVRRLDLDFDAVGWLPTAPRGWVEWRGLVSLQYVILCDEDSS